MSDNDTVSKFEAFADSMRRAGGTATCFYADATDPKQIGELIQSIEADHGPIAVVIYNIGAQVTYASFMRSLCVVSGGA
jgi:NAD(P)-dependent dehydrogenase (short-subunit alcohol dehydrogenase family)